MTREYLSEVRDQLASRSTTASLSELKQRGLHQVRVIRSSQVLQLIEEAVDRALASRGLSEQHREEVVNSSREIFQQMVAAPAAGPDPELVQELMRRVEEADGVIAQLRADLGERDQSLQQERAHAAEINAELQMFQKRSATSAPEALLDELRALRNDIKGAASAPATAAPVPAELQQQIASLGRELGQEIERIGRRVGVAPVEESAAVLSGLFAVASPELESNLSDTRTEQRKSTDVSDALQRMKALKGNKG